MQCAIDCNITVEFIPGIMMGRGDFISAGAVIMWVGEQRSESGEGRGRFHLCTMYEAVPYLL